MNPNLPLPAGHALGPYTVARLVAEGGTRARVYEATDGDGQRVALKVLRSTEDMEDDLAERFEREVAVVGKLEHPNTPRLLAQGVEGPLRYIVFPFFDHETLGERVARVGALPPGEVLRILEACASALHAVHALGILHRDVKPSNILILEDQTVMLIDFGLALIAHTSQLTHADEVVGTYGYIAPEALMGDRENLSGEADVYSLGCVAFEALTGRPPFTDRILTQLVAAHMEREAPDPRSIVKDTPPALAELLNTMLRKEPSRRPPVEALLQKVRQLRAELG